MILSLIKSDLYRYSGDYKFISFIKFWYYPGFRYTFFLRIASSNKKRFLMHLFAVIFLRRYSIKYGIQIPRTTTIGKGLYIGHYGNIIINPKTIIGKNCNINQGVTIGQSNRGKKVGSPQIGDSVWIGANTVIVGNVKIGNNVLITPNCYINTDIPNDVIVINENKLKILESKESTKDYINNIII